MKNDTSALDLSYLVKEFQSIIGSKVNKVFQEDYDFTFDLFKTGIGKIQLRMILPNFIFVTKYKPNYSEPGKFCIFLRRRLNNAIIKSIKQKDFERILEITFETKSDKYILIIELFSKGNLILCDENMKIISPLQPQSWQARTIRGGTQYVYPPEQVDPRKLTVHEFEEILQSSGRDEVVKTLAKDLSLSGFYAEEVCKRAKIDKTTSPKDVDSHNLYKIVQKIFDEKIEATLFEGNVVPFALEGEKFDSFSDAIDETISKTLVQREAGDIAGIKESKVKKVETILKEQEKAILQMDRDADINQKKAELIFQNYQVIKELLDEVNKDRKKMSWDDLKEKYKGHKLVKEINEKQGQIVIDI